MKLLLISNTLSKNGGLLDHCFSEIKKIVGKNKVLYIPFALKDWDKYEALLKKRFTKENILIQSIHKQNDFKAAVKNAKVIFIGGGNTFRLLSLLKRNNLMTIIKEKVKEGSLSYIGSSAGANVACPTIMTTNDMPIVELSSFKSLGLISFQINPHYIDPKSEKKDKMETRDDRILQFLEENNIPVLGLREESCLICEDGNLKLIGRTGAKLFQKNKEVKEIKHGELLNYLL